jgi:hypothetical protein
MTEQPTPKMKQKRPRTLADQKAALEKKQAEIAQRLRDIKSREAATARKERTGQLIALGLSVAGALDRGEISPDILRTWAGQLGQRERDRIERYLASLTTEEEPLDSPPPDA